MTNRSSSSVRPSGFAAPASAWRNALPALALVIALVLFLYRDTAIAMVSIWSRSDTFAHAFLVPPIVLWLIWQKRQALAAFSPRPAGWVLLPMACLGLVWLLGDLVASNAVTQTAFTAMLVLSVPTLLGTPVARAILFPLGFLFFSVPIGEFLVPQMMEATSHFTVLALRASGIPVYQDGLQFVIPTGSWSVVEACSGVRYLIASFMVGTLFAYLNYRSMKRRLLFIGLSILVPILANWIRAYMIVMLGHLSGNQIAAGADHLVYGWVLFGVVMITLYVIGARWSEPDADVPARTITAAPAPRQRHRTGPWAFAAGIVAILTLPHAALWALGQAENVRNPELRLPDALAAGWQASDVPVADWKPSFRNPSAESVLTYRARDRAVGVYVAYYRHQDPMRKLISTDNALVGSSRVAWRQVASDGRTLQIAGNPVRLRTATLSGPAADTSRAERLVVWQTYWVGGTLTSSDARAKALEAWNRLLGRGDDAAVVMLFALGDTKDAEATLEAFARDNLDAIQAQLLAVRDAR